MGPLSPHSGTPEFSVQIALSPPPGTCLPHVPRSEVTGREIPTPEHEDTQAQGQLKGSFRNGGRRVTKSRVKLTPSPRQCRDISAQSPQAGTKLLAPLSSLDPSTGLAPRGDLVGASWGSWRGAVAPQGTPQWGGQKALCPASVSSVLSSPSLVLCPWTFRGPSGRPMDENWCVIILNNISPKQGPCGPWGLGAAAGHPLEWGHRASSTTGLCEVGPPLCFPEVPLSRESQWPPPACQA